MESCWFLAVLITLFVCGTLVKGVRFLGESETRWALTLAIFNLLRSAPPERYLLRRKRQNEIHLWSAAEHKLVGTLNTGETVEALAFHPNGRFLAAGVWEKIRVWDMETQEEVAPLEGSLGRVNTIAFSSDGNTLVGSAGHGVIRVWDTSGLGSD